eukprot:scaffold85537_cov30-Tisochrysis_lutea.AAC.1
MKERERRERRDFSPRVPHAMADANDFSAPYVQFEGAGASSGISRRRERWGWWRACLGASQHEAR